MEIQSLNQNLTNEKIRRPYPSLEILDPSDAVAWVVPTLPTGDLPILCTYQGKTAKVGSCNRSALTLNTLLKITGLDFHESVGNVKHIKSVQDIMDIMEVL